MAIANTNTGWVNADGQRVKFPGDGSSTTLGLGGTYEDQLGGQTVTSFAIDYAKVALGLTATNVYILDYDVVLPDTAVIDKIEFITGAAWTSASSDVALNFGIVKRSDFTSIVDADGLVDTLAFSVIDAAGETTSMTPGGTYAGALMGVQAGIGFDGVVCTFWENHVPTAGTGTLRIYWRHSSSVLA